MSLKRSSLFLFAAALSLSGGPAVADEGRVLSDADFRQAFYRAAAGFKNSFGAKDLADGGKLYGVENVRDTEGGHAVTLNTFNHWHTGSIRVTKSTAAAVNTGSGFEFMHRGIPINPNVREDVLEEVVPSLEKFQKKNPDLNVTWTIDEGVIDFRSEYAYPEGVDAEDAEEVLETLIGFNKGFMHELHDENNDALEDYQKNLMKRKISYLTKEDLIFITRFHTNLGRLRSDRKAPEVVKEGSFSFKRSKKYNIEIENYGDRLLLIQWFRFPDGLSDEEKTALVAEYDARLGKKSAKYATRTYAERDPAAPNSRYRAVVEYVFDGKLKGGKLFDSIQWVLKIKYLEPYYEYAQKINKKYTKD